MIINGIIMQQTLVEKIFRIGFEHLQEASPFNRGTVIFSQRSNVWRAYLLEENPGLITPTPGEDGQFEIDFRAKEFVSLVSATEFLQVNVILSFNHLKAIRFFDSL